MLAYSAMIVRGKGLVLRDHLPACAAVVGYHCLQTPTNQTHTLKCTSTYLALRDSQNRLEIHLREVL